MISEQLVSSDCKANDAIGNYMIWEHKVSLLPLLGPYRTMHLLETTSETELQLNHKSKFKLWVWMQKCLIYNLSLWGGRNVYRKERRGEGTIKP